jgi:serine/threonine-protein kinase
MTDLDRLTAALADRYAIEHELGAGGMATVYLAHDVRHNRKVAVKVLRPELAAVLGGERFLKEIEVTANLQHPHILPLFDSGEADSFLYYVMPFVEGESLRDKLKREKQLAVEEALKITEAVAGALDYAHRQEIVHRDIKPENILLHDGQALVADFGIALAVSAAGGGRLTETGLSLGTPHYMSPEQATADRELDARSDVYSLACVAYEMLAGEPPHIGNNAQAIIAKILTDPPRPVRELRSTAPTHVEAVLDKALQKLPADRFATAKEFADALSDPRSATLAATARLLKTGVAGPTTRWTASGSLLTAMVVTLSVGLVAGWLIRPVPTSERTSVRFGYRPDSTHSVFSACCGPPVAISPDGRRIVYEGSAGSMNQLYLRQIDELEARPLPGTEGARSIFFSPDGEWVGFVSQAPYALMKIPVAGGAPVTIVELDEAGQGATWTDEDDIIYSTRASRGLYRVSASGGVPQRLTVPDSTAAEADHRFPHFVSEAGGVLYTAWPFSGNIADAQVAMLDLGSGATHTVHQGFAPYYTASGHLVNTQDGGIVVAQAFDAAKGETTGPPIRIAEGAMIRADGTTEYGISRTGTLVVTDWRGGEAATLQMVNRSGSVESTRFPIAGVGHLDNPRFSPDGRRLAVAAAMAENHQIYVLDLDGGTAQRITFDGDTQFLDWTDRGDTIVYSHAGRGVAMRAADGSGEEHVALPLSDGTPNHISVQGPWIAVGHANGDILVTHRDSAGTHSVYAGTTFGERAPAISPDGRWLAYESNETGRFEIYVGAFPTSAGRTIVSIEGGTEPVWSPDGMTLYYRNPDDDFVAVSVRSGDTFAAASREPVFSMPADRDAGSAAYDVHPSGESFILVGGRETTGTEIVVITNAVVRR